jgi:translation initiation factor 2 subunit 1
MSTISSKAIPEKNDLVLGTVFKITDHGVYAKLFEYDNLEAYCHISEVAGAWIRNIRNFVRIDQQIVAKVVRSTKSGQIDISIKRVTAQQKKEKTVQYKNQMAALAIVSLIAKNLSITESEVREKIEDVFIEEFGSLYHGLEFIATDDEFNLDEIVKLDKKFKETLIEMTKSSIKVQTYEKEIVLGLRSFASDGVEQVRKVLTDVSQKLDKEEKIHYELFTIGAPKYRLWISGQFHEDVDHIMEDIKQQITTNAEKLENFEFTFQEKKV